jgi:acetyl-CoA carboxylase biotin carboxylase subunit
LDEFALAGLETTLPLYLAILEDEAFRRGGISTTFLAERELRNDGNGLLRLVAADRPAAS